ncbi:MAG: peptidylprolyl isomerase [Nitrospirae bacterium]|nr:peptidylprolyl isomerase [Nitrospirota bacterium]MDE3039704.1 peptidylprolyl isomerase [Nitrospirota bacterium]MDE3050869.1 peptidylprolyl isomerase [Nitrospirota bacterium]MDE3221481.1 peptidylprolyl isomerase [Nitrospirota bacterium]
MKRLAMLRGVCSAWVLCWALMDSPVGAESSKSDVNATVSAGRTVSLEYTLTLDDQSVLESNVGKEPMTYTQGAHEIVPGLETAMEGMKKGERKRVVVTPADGYGPIDPQAIREVKKELIPAAAQKVGAQLQGQAADGSTAFPRVKEIKAETVVLDFNHPLAGKTLHFDVTVLAISEGKLPKQP